jgi:hypothetical protein
MQKVRFFFLTNVEPRSISCFVFRNSSSTSKVEPEATESDVTHKQTTLDPQTTTARQSEPPPQSLQEPRRPVRTNRTTDLQIAALMHNP